MIGQNASVDTWNGWYKEWVSAAGGQTPVVSLEEAWKGYARAKLKGEDTHDLLIRIELLHKEDLYTLPLSYAYA